MSGPLQITVLDRQQIVYEGEFVGPVELGRQGLGDSNEEVGRPRRLESGIWRVVIARYDENTISRQHALIEPIAHNKVRITNLSAKLPIHMPTGERLDPSAPGQNRKHTYDAVIPLLLNLGPKSVRIQEPSEVEGILHSLSEVSRPPGARFSVASSEPLLSLVGKQSGLATPDEVEPETLVAWFQGIIGVLQDAANAEDFFSKAAEAMVKHVELDTGWVLTWEEGKWVERASTCPDYEGADPDRKPSRRFLDQVRQRKSTSWIAPDQGGGSDSNRSLIPVKAVVAAPILDRDGEVIGVIYGDRRQSVQFGGSAQFSKLEALLVELLAGGVAAGLSRLKQERRVVQYQGQMAAFLGSDLAQELEEHPDWKEGRETEISILFADIRGFSRISKLLGNKATFDWINDVMEKLSECVVRHDGLVVDYIGDELMAMWGAPKPNSRHAELACRAGLDMLSAVPKINEAWRDRLAEDMGLGVGINTGMAQVGNTGCAHKFKYGPLGNTVNLASRVQGATKYLKTGLVVTEPTHKLIGESFLARRLCSVQVVNIKDPVALYELAAPELFNGNWHDLRRRYIAALEAFENQRGDDQERQGFREAARTLGNLLTDYPGDGPSLVLMRRAVNGLIEGPDPDHPVWELPGK